MGSPDGTKVKSKCTFSPEVGNHAEPAVRTSSTSRHPPGFPPPTCIPGTIVLPSFGVDAMDPARFLLDPVPSGMFHGPAVAPENLNPVNGHGVTCKVDVVEPSIHGPAITRERSQGRYGTDIGLPGESVHSLSDITKMFVRCGGSEAVFEQNKFTGNPLDYFKFIRQVEDRILSLSAESDPAHALYLLLEATSGRAYKLISGCVMLSPEKGLREALHLLHKAFGSPLVAVRSFIDSVCCGDTISNTEMGLEEFYSHLVNCKVVLEAAGAHNLLNAASTAERIFMRLPNALNEGFVQLALDRGFDMDVVPFDLFIEFVDYKHRLMCSRFGRLLQPSSYKSAARFKTGYKARANVVQNASDAVTKQSEREKPITQVVCSCCDSLGHVISRCGTFAQMGVVACKEFARQRHLRYNCLGKGHGVKNCPSRTRCRRCSRKHHSLLHQPSEVTGDEETTLHASKGDTTPGLPSNQAPTSTLSAASTTQVKTRLQVLPICVINNITGTCKDTLALLDSGADCHLISEGLYTELGLVGSPIHPEMQLANGGIESLETFSSDCTVRGVLEDNVFVLENVRVVPRLPDLSGSKPSPEDVGGCPYLAGIEIPKIEADCVQLIIGIDSPALHTFSEIRQDGNSKLRAGKSPLGWVLHGRDGTNGRDSQCSVNLLVDSQVTPALGSLCPCQFDYVDDVLTSAPDIDSAVKLVNDVEALLQGGGFELAKLSSNLPEVLEGLPAERLASELNQVDLSPEMPKQKTLGLVWYPQEDVLGVKVSEVAYPVTRRGLLSLVMSIFDPLGFLSPFLLPLKLLLQRLVKLGWDADMPKAEKQTLRKFSKRLLKLGEISISRCLGGFSSLENVQLHVFADASSVGIGAVFYLRMSNANNCFVSFMMGKSRVAPTKPLTVPRLELCAAVIAVRLAKFVTRELDVTPEKTVFWSDSTTVLSYLQNTSKRRPVFETNRIKLIREHSSVEQWRWVNTNANPADLYSRGVSPSQPHKAKMWLIGPSFLFEPEDTWPTAPRQPESTVAITNITSQALHQTDLTPEEGNLTEGVLGRIINKYSVLHQAVRTAAWLLRLKRQLYARITNKSIGNDLLTDYIDANEYDAALLALISLAQRQEFGGLVKALERHLYHKIDSGECGKDLKRLMKPILKYCPFVEAGILRIGGRLQRSGESYDVKHPIILPPLLSMICTARVGITLLLTSQMNFAGDFISWVKRGQ